MKEKFIGTTVCIDFYERGGIVILKVVSGHNMARLNSIPTDTISITDYNNRPVNPHNSTREAIWAMELCGIEV